MQRASTTISTPAMRAPNAAPTATPTGTAASPAAVAVGCCGASSPLEVVLALLETVLAVGLVVPVLTVDSKERDGSIGTESVNETMGSKSENEATGGKPVGGAGSSLSACRTTTSRRCPCLEKRDVGAGVNMGRGGVSVRLLSPTIDDAADSAPRVADMAHRNVGCGRTSEVWQLGKMARYKRTVVREKRPG
jgi:hypothetical protein